MSVATPYENFGIADVQIHEYSKTLSLPIDPAKNKGATIGSVVSVGDIFGIMVTEVGLTPEQTAAEQAKDRFYMPFKSTIRGHNAPGYASVRVHGGVFKIKGVGHTGAKPVGSVVYAHQDGDHVTVNFTEASGTRIGFLTKAIPAGGSSADAIVALD